MYITNSQYWKALAMAYHPQVQITAPDSLYCGLFGYQATAYSFWNEIDFPDGRWDVFGLGEYRVILLAEILQSPPVPLLPAESPQVAPTGAQ